MAVPLCADEADCPYWEDTSPVPTLEETLSSQTKINSLGLGTADSFYGGTRPNIVPIGPGGRKKIKPRRSAPPPPKKEGFKFSGGSKANPEELETSEGYETPHRYVLQPTAMALPSHSYKQLDPDSREGAGSYTNLVRAGSLPTMQLCSTSTFESS